MLRILEDLLEVIVQGMEEEYFPLFALGITVVCTTLVILPYIAP